MPAYDFKCKKCSAVVEVVRPTSDDSPVICPECGGETRRVFTPVGVHFKGSGFHNTDYRKTQPPEGPTPQAPSCPAQGPDSSCAGCPAAED
jgi:putative FmdB family regulatory protein